MSKNKIIGILIERLLDQRESLNNAIIELNNEEASLDKRTSFELQISIIDMQIDKRIIEIEPTR